MTTVKVTLGAAGELLAAEASGHAGTAPLGKDLVCAAVTALLRTTLSVVASGEGGDESSAPRVDAESAGRGELSFRVTAHEAAHGPFLRYAARFLLEGIGSLERDAPGAISLRVEKTFE